MAFGRNTPSHCEQVTDINEVVQKGDYYYDEEDGEWHGVSWSMIGRHVTQLYAVARPKPVNSVRIKRTRTKKV